MSQIQHDCESELPRADLADILEAMAASARNGTLKIGSLVLVETGADTYRVSGEIEWGNFEDGAATVLGTLHEMPPAYYEYYLQRAQLHDALGTLLKQ